MYDAKYWEFWGLQVIACRYADGGGFVNVTGANKINLTPDLIAELGGVLIAANRWAQEGQAANA